MRYLLLVALKLLKKTIGLLLKPLGCKFEGYIQLRAKLARSIKNEELTFIPQIRTAKMQAKIIINGGKNDYEQIVDNEEFVLYAKVFFVFN